MAHQRHGQVRCLCDQTVEESMAWFLGQRRLNPQLQVKRFQVPLVPTYSMIANSLQGRTLVSAIIELQIGRGVSAIASYVAMTRVQTRLDLLI
jgi:hypothetical protein